jgi:branched-chain amino acid transport system ATP-binding protein
MESLLRVRGLRVSYGRIEVLHDICVEVEEHTLCAIVGANGAGKTTLLLALSRILPVRAGTITFAGRDVTRARPHDVVRAGLVQVPEGRRMLATLSVEENLQVAAAARPAPERRTVIDEMLERFPALRTRRKLPAGALSGGEQQMLAMARALAMHPRVLLLDEPSMGLAPKLVDELFAIIAAERARGTTILLVEQNARKALALADRAYVLERGRVVLEGSGAELLGREEVVTAYLGGAAAGLS